MVSPQVEISASQYTESVPLELCGQSWYGESWNGQSWNGESHSRRQNAVKDPSWWTAYVENESFLDESDVNQFDYDSPTAFQSVSFEISDADEEESSSIDAPFQATCQPSESCHGTFENTVFISPGMIFQLRAPSACPDGPNSEDFWGSAESCQSYRNPVVSYSTPQFDFDTDCQTDAGILPYLNAPSGQVSEKSGKRQIARLDPLKCPHCCKTVYTKHQLKYVNLIENGKRNLLTILDRMFFNASNNLVDPLDVTFAAHASPARGMRLVIETHSPAKMVVLRDDRGFALVESLIHERIMAFATLTQYLTA
jgi:hypothetical protein